MYKKIAFAAAGIILVASPVLASAQGIGFSDTCANAPTVACLQSEIEQLVQILNQLLLLHGQNHSTSPSATIDVNSLLASTGGKDAAVVILTGTASNVSQIQVSLDGADGGPSVSVVTVTNNQWLATFASVSPGTHSVTVIDADAGPSYAKTLTTGTLTVGGTSGQSNSFIISAPAPTPYALAAGGSTQVTVGSFQLQTSNTDNVTNLQQIGLQVTNGSPADITRAYIYSGSFLVGSVVFAGTNGNASTTLSSPFVVSTPAIFTIKADIAGIGVGQAGTAGDLVQIGVTGAMGTNSGSIITGNAAPAVLTGAGVRIFKSYPTVAPIPLTQTIPTGTGTASSLVLLKFSVTAGPNGPIGIASMFAQMAASGVTFSSVAAYGFTDPAFSQPISGTASPNGNLGIINPSGGLTGSFSMALNNGVSPFEIPAGQTDYFEFIGNVSNISGNASVTTTLDGDSTYLFGSSSISAGSNFIWSPNDNGTSQEPGNDWTNGYGVPGLPTTGISQTRTTTNGIPTQTDPVIISSFTVSSNSVTAGQPVTFSWSSNLSATDISYYKGGCAIYSPTINNSIGLNSSGNPSDSFTYTPASTATYTLECDSGGKDGSPSAKRMLTVTVTPPTVSSTVTYVSNSGGSVTASYANLPAGSQIIVVNQTSGQRVSGVSATVNGSGTITLSGLPVGTFFLRAFDASANYLAQSVSFTSSGTANSTMTYVSNSGGSVTGSYANLPAGSLIVVINVTSNQPVSGVSAAVSGSGTVTLNNLPAGSFYMKAQDAAGNYLAQSISFTSAGSTVQPTVGTCTRTILTAMGPPTTISITGGASACSAYCSSLDLEDGTHSSCVYNDLSVSGSGNTNLASALTALESALQGLEQWLGK